METNEKNEVPIIQEESTGAVETSPNQGSGQRLFTQEEVNRIIKKRLETKKREQQNADDVIEERVTQALAERTADLDSRERRLDCKAYLTENGYSSELLDIIDTSDVETFVIKVEALQGLIKNTAVYPVVRDGGEVSTSFSDDAGIKDAFMSNKPHTPKPPKPF